MICIYRFIWLIGYVPIFTLEVLVLLLMIFTYPILGAFYFIKTGDVENIPFTPVEPAIWIDEKYHSLLGKN